MAEHDQDEGSLSHSGRGGLPSRPSGGAASRPAPTIHDDPTIVEDDPKPAAAPASAQGHRLPGGLERLAERYQLEEPIAAGGAAMVWRAFDEVLSRTVAIKLLHAHLAGDPRTVERFRQESINAARLTHPNVVAIYDTGQENDLVYLVMEYVDGPTLREVIAQRGALDPDEVTALGQQVAAALGEAHAQGLVHRDVKPANILLTSDGTAKVTDFGIAKALSTVESVTTTPGLLVGTAAYVAPEQLGGGAAVDPRADVYSLGVVLHEALTGRRAFRGETASATAAARLSQQLEAPRRHRLDVPRPLDEVVARATRNDPVDRYEDGAEMAAALAPLLRREASATTEELVRTYHSREDDGGGLAPVTYEREQRRRWHVPMRVRRDAVPFVAGVAAALTGVLLLAATPTLEQPAAWVPDTDGAEVFAQGDFDPYGDDREDPTGVLELVDADPATSWHTEHYAGGLTEAGLPGVGVWFDLGEPVAVQDVRLDTITGVDRGEVMVRDAPPAATDTEDAWRTVATFGPLEAGSRSRVEVDTTARWWLVWLTDLEQQDGVGLAEIGGVAFEDAGAAGSP